ncbi:hypothetical protein BZARG_2168 [Bizionia argentinensis JUB59]|uniref:SD-repeat containing protein B domain-containing protein n=1 Tax=Bizionia argentinensis JUB59 TaxID=1046627 RepID=G2EAH6_9FLAO|nr:hypothetical protein BZARG_2168 [Bizionia argentinensis JUB59]
MVLFCLFSGYAQDKSKLGFYFETDTISVEQGQSFINFLVLKNASDQDITLQNIQSQEKYSGLLLSTQPYYTILKGEKKRLPIKFIANVDFMKMKSPDIIYQLSYLKGAKLQSLEASFFIERNEEKQIALYSFSRDNYINPTQTESTFSVFVENRGYSKRSVKLSFQSTPENLDIQPKEIIVSLEGQEKRLVEFQVSVRERNNIYPDYNVTVKATDLITNENVGNTYLKLVVLSNNRQVKPSYGGQMGENFVELAYNEQSSGFNYMQFKGNTSFSVSKDIKATLNVATDYYLNENKYNLYDTWLEVESKKSLLRIGNIYANEYDYSVSGRGVLFGTQIGEKKIEVFALENNYNLYGTYFSESKGANISGAKYQFGTENAFSGKVSYLFDHNPRLGIDSHLAHGSTTFKLNSIHSFQVDAGISHEKGVVYQDENSGASARLNYRSQIGNWDFQSTNSLASKSYAGLNRGSYNFNQNLGYEFAKRQRIFLQYQNSQINPEYITLQNSPQGSIYFRPQYFYSTQSAQLGYQFVLANWNILLAPEVEKQKNISNFSSNELLSYRLRSNISTTFGEHGINLSLEYSNSKAAFNSEWFESFKSNISYRYKNISLTGSLQVNPQNVIDLNSYNNGSEEFTNYNIYASYNFQNDNRSLTGSISAGTNFSGLYNNQNHNVSGNLEYKISPSWAATGYGNYSSYQSNDAYGYAADNYQFSVGIKKYFIKATMAGNHKVRLQLYDDTNSNGILDASESVLTNERVKLDDFVAITDKNGKVIFQNVPSGNYKLEVNRSAGLQLMMDPMIVVDRNVKLEVGLIKNKRITGKLVEIKQAYDVLDTDVRGVIIYARNQAGEIQTTVVNQNNEFEFFLKDEVYDIYIQNDKYNYSESLKRIDVKNSPEIKILIFEYSKKDTTIKVKKF